MNLIWAKFFILYNNFISFFYQLWLRKAVKIKGFSVISNNCFAGHIYQDLKLEYATPTAGLYFIAQDYIKFLSNLKYYTNIELQFSSKSRFESENIKREQRQTYYPIGILDDIEIHFLHYNSNEEAKKKWERRCKRINFKNLYIKMDDQNNCTYEDIVAFDKLPYERKVFFSAKDYPELKCVIYLPYYKNFSCVGNLHGEKYSFICQFNLAKWLNEGRI